MTENNTSIFNGLSDNSFDADDMPMGKGSWYHDPSTGQFLTLDGEKYPFEFHPRKRLFIDHTGRELKFRIIPTQVIMNFQQAYQRKHMPQIPTKAYDIGDGDYSYESDPNDPAYKAKLEQYEINMGLALVAWQVSRGLKFTVPKPEAWDDDFTDLVSYTIDKDDPLIKHRVRYLYLMNGLLDSEAMILIQLLQGQTMPTVEGIKSAEARFPSDSE